MAVDVSSLIRIIKEEEPDIASPVTRDLLGGSNSILAPSKNLGIQDLNFPPPSLELGAFPPPPASVSSGNRNRNRNRNLSVCTLDKVKLALERAKAGSNRNSELENSDSKSSIEEEVSLTGPMLAAGCPECLFYVLVSPEDPTCPRCSAVVPCPAKKKRRVEVEFEFDLNSS